MYVINLWGAPSSGKSTTAAGLFFLMKVNKMKVELVTEYAKDLVWSERNNIFNEQNKIFAEQAHRLNRLDGKIDYAITDSPLPLTVFYEPKEHSQHFEPMVLEKFNTYKNINFLLKRVSDFENFGRIHSEQESDIISNQMQKFLEFNKIEYTELEATPTTPNKILESVVEKTQPKYWNKEQMRDLTVSSK